ncbi:MAG TPA: hypothetical protein VGQ85_08425, partial [Candidatus Limnocylindrales bacterium]|nr:hypothetical protein [Candidatus Limnocylindrales bacterium]
MIKVTEAVAARAEASSRDSMVARAVATFLVVLIGRIGVALLFGAAGWSWVLAVPIGLIAGAIARRAGLVWVALA